MGRLESFVGTRRLAVFRLSSVSVATRLAASIVAVSVLSLLATTFIGVSSGQSLSQQLNEQQLVGLRTTGALGVADYMEGLSRTAETVASSPQTAFAIDAFAQAHRDLDTPDANVSDSLVARYRVDYIEPFSDVGIELDSRDIVSESPAALYLQHTYGAPIRDDDDAISVDDAGDGTDWSVAHAALHPAFREVVQRRGLIDLLLVEPENSFVVYSARKQPDLGTSLRLGPFSGSSIADAVNRAAASPSGGVVLSDLSFYPPAGLNPVGAVASPVVVDGSLAGVVVLIYDSSELTNILSANRDWDRAGYPPTSDTVLISSDGTTRSDPRAFIEDPTSFAADLAESSRLDQARAQIDAAETTVLVHEVDPQTLSAALNGVGEAERRPTSLGGQALSSVGSVAVNGLDWFVVAEVSTDVADSDLGEFQNVLIAGAAIFVVGLAFAAVAWSRRILRPVRELSDRLGDHRDGHRPVNIPEHSPTEFHRLGSSFESMKAALEDRQTRLNDARGERLDLLRRLLPPAAAERVANGDVQGLDAVSQATVVVVVVRGLGALVRDDDNEANRLLIDRLYADLDDIADEHGLGRIKVVGDAYFAVCGHETPYIDHAPRSVAFAADAQYLIAELHGPDASVERDASNLGSAIGIHSGSVTVGMAGGSRLVYDVWGKAVSVAHRLARSGSDRQILASSDTAALLPETTVRHPVQRAENPSPYGDVPGPASSNVVIDVEVWEISANSVRAGA